MNRWPTSISMGLSSFVACSAHKLWESVRKDLRLCWAKKSRLLIMDQVHRCLMSYRKAKDRHGRLARIKDSLKCFSIPRTKSFVRIWWASMNLIEIKKVFITLPLAFINGLWIQFMCLQRRAKQFHLTIWISCLKRWESSVDSCLKDQPQLV